MRELSALAMSENRSRRSERVSGDERCWSTLADTGSVMDTDGTPGAGGVHANGPSIHENFGARQEPHACAAVTMNLLSPAADIRVR